MVGRSDMGRLLFFILMPIVYEGINLLIHHFGQYREGNWRSEIKFYSILLAIDYIIEIIYSVIIKNVLGVWIISSKFNNIETYGAYGIFVFFAVVWIIVSIFFKAALDENDGMPVFHTIFLVILFAIFSFIMVDYIHDTQDQGIFDSLEYQLEDNTIYLRAMGDGHTTTGDIQGRSFLGSGYIQGNIADNYNLYYAFVNENGETVIQNIPYNNSVHIYEEGESCEPRIVFHRYYKSYVSEYNSFYNEYYTYDIFIPSMIDGVRIDME